jgi:hypothetical protein
MFQQPTRYQIPKDNNVGSMSRKINYKMYVTSDSTLPKLPGLRITIKFSRQDGRSRADVRKEGPSNTKQAYYQDSHLATT